MARTWTDAQKAAIRTTDRTLLVSAAAGSGKTATLTERVIQSLTHPDHPVDIDRILIVTFTKAAAAELRQRISDALLEQLAANPQNTRLYKQTLNLSGAHIGTIDSFYLDVIRSHFSAVDFPAAFRIADKAELLPLCERVMERAIDTFYAKYASSDTGEALFSLLENNPFADLCDCLTPSKNDNALIGTFLDLYERLLGFPEGLGRLKTEGERLCSQAGGDFLRSDHGSLLKAWLDDFCKSGLNFYRHVCPILEADEKAEKAYLPSFLNDRTFFEALADALHAGDFATVNATIAAHSALSLKGIRDPQTVIKEAKLRRADYLAEIKNLKEILGTTALSLEDQMMRCGQLCLVLHEFLTYFDAEILAEKRARGICDFFDVSRLLLSILQNPDGSPTPLADEYARRFDQVYIDEYQDVDQVQDRIFALIGRDHRFMVGDIKQSIYGFRGADPTVFSHYRKTLPPMSTDPEDDTPSPSTPETGGSIFMSSNFRCDESVIRVSNAVCSHCFSACPGTIDYRPEDDLGFAKKPPSEEYQTPRVQIDVLVPRSKEERAAMKEAGMETDVNEVECEAMHVANRIAALLRTPTSLADGTPIRPGDITVLVRSKSNLDTFSAAMAAMGIPTDCGELEREEAGQTILHGREMMYWMNLLRIIDNPHRDIPLSEFIRSPFPGLTLEDVVTLRCLTKSDGDDAGSLSLYQAMERYLLTAESGDALGEKLRTFINWLSEYRRLCAVLSADGLLRLLQRDSRLACRQSKAFRFLYDRARTYRGEAFADLYSFLSYFERLLVTQKEIKLPSDDDQNGRVTLMTVHGSKGLEFPVCFLVQCGKSFSAKSLRSDLLFEPDAGVSFKLFNRADGQKYNSMLRLCTSRAIKSREREDEMRLLYVAMTRARERLYLCGVGSENTQDAPSFPVGDRFSALSCGNYLEWITAALKEHPEAAPFYDMTYLYLDSISPDVPLTREDMRAVGGGSAPQANRYRDILARRLPETELDRRLRSVPTKVSASQFNDHLLDACVFSPHDPVLTLDVGLHEEPTDLQSIRQIEEAVRLLEAGDGQNDFELLLKANQKPTAAEKGTAVHLFLQYCDMGRLAQSGAPDVQGELDRLVAEGFLSRRTADMIDLSLLSRFFGSAFFARLSDASEVGREVRFSRFVPLRELTDDPLLAERLGDRTLYVQGSIDLLLTYPDGSIDLCDYKTDAISPEEKANPALLQKRFSEKHGPQLRQYALAVRELYHRLPRHVYIYSLPLGEAVEIDLGALTE